MRVIAVLVAVGFCCFAAQAQVTVDYNAGFGTPAIADHTGTVLPDYFGNNVELGFFDTTGGYDFTAHLNDLPSLGSHWHQFDATNIKTLTVGTFSESGRFAATGTQFSSLFNGMHIDLWIFKTTDLFAPAVDFSNVLEYGIFSGSGANWTFPTQGTAPPGNTTTVQTDQVNQFYVGSLVGGNLDLAPVPEPTGLALLGLGLVMVLGRRARR